MEHLPKSAPLPTQAQPAMLLSRIMNALNKYELKIEGEKNWAIKLVGCSL